MTPIRKLIVLTIILAIFSLACGLGGAAKDAIEEKAADVADQAQQAAESIATEAAPAVEQAQETAQELATEAAPAVEQAQETAEELATEAAPALEEAQQAAGDAAEQAGDTEPAALEVGSIDQTLANFSSYRTEIEINFDGTDSDGQPSVGKITVSTENVKEPAATHMRMQMEGTTVAETGDFGMFEVYLVDGMTYMQNPEDGSWMSFPAGDDDTFTSGFFSADDMVNDLPKSAKRSLLPQTVNGISCWHYTFDETDFADETDMTVEDASGEVWLARDGGYPVKMKFNITGSNVSDNPEGVGFYDGTMNFEYNLLDVNQPIDIVLPDEAKNAGSMFGGGGGDTGDSSGGDSGSGMASTADLPLPNDAEVQFSMEGMMSYTTQQSPQAIADFYKAELSDWTSEDTMEMTDETGLLLSFISPDESVNLMIAGQIEDDGSLSVSVIATEQ